MQFENHLIKQDNDARSALKMLDELPDNQSRTLFVVGSEGKLTGTITDGDIRRGLLGGREISDRLELFMNKKFKSLPHNDPDHIISGGTIIRQRFRPYEGNLHACFFCDPDYLLIVGGNAKHIIFLHVLPGKIDRIGNKWLSFQQFYIFARQSF